jgi:hypothetical protein
MRNSRTVMLMLFAVVAVGVITTDSASAVEPQLLSEGLAISASLSIEISSETLYEDMKISVFGIPDGLCSETLDGSVESGGHLGLIEFVLKLDGTLLTPTGAVGTSTDGEPDMLDCTDTNKFCSNGEAEKMLIIFLLLPWHFEIILVGTLFYYLSLLAQAEKTPSYELVCETMLGTLTDVCETAEGKSTNMVLANEAAGLLGEFSENEERTAPGNCPVGGAAQGLQASDGFLTASGGALTVSE